jgi:hypothetical protein
MATFHFSLPHSVSEKDVFASSTNAAVFFERPDAFSPASITKSDQETFTVSVQDLPKKAGDSDQGTEEKATLYLMKGDKAFAKIPLTEKC